MASIRSKQTGTYLKKNMLNEMTPINYKYFKSHGKGNYRSMDIMKVEIKRG